MPYGIELPLRVIADAMERCKQINQTGNTDASFTMDIPQRVNENTFNLTTVRFIQTIDGWVMRL